MTKLHEMVELTGKAVFDYLDMQSDLPLVDKIAAQGDVMVRKDATFPAAKTVMPKTVVVVASEASSNTHTLHPSGECFYEALEGGGLTLGTLTVPEGSTALLSHQEHGGLEILPGTYTISRQREFGAEWRMVHD